MSDRTLAVILASGGMDSCVATAWANQRYRLAMLHASYGQRTEAKERDCFDRQVAHFQPAASLVVDLPHLAQIGGSSLTDSGLAIPEDDAAGVVPSTYVPFRNATLLAVAVAWAEVLGAGRIVIGAVEPDAPGYPDCRPAFFEAANRLIDLGTRPETAIRVETPVIALAKADVVQMGTDLAAPLELTWSCYRREDTPCGACASCLRRAEAFRDAGVADPLMA
ncbi:MAG: 7-cyano-7-deazaguanine synthase QueC [Planctomycetota bacterium]|nr:7-cyano-7-deazaguanine synthase QueC [Planctomycetota bacterium]